MILLLSLRLYLFLNFWMYSLELKIYFVDEVSVVPIILGYQNTIIFLGLTLISGALLVITPGMGLLIGILVVLLFAIQATYEGLVGRKLILKMHEEAQRICRVTADGSAIMEDTSSSDKEKLAALKAELNKIDPTFGPRYGPLLLAEGVDVAMMPKLMREDFKGLGISLGPTIMMMEHFGHHGHY